MEIDDPHRSAREHAAESPTTTALRRIMIASSMGLATLAMVATTTTGTALGGRTGQDLAAGGAAPAITSGTGGDAVAG